MTDARLLIVEDDRDLTHALQLERSHAGYDVRSVADGPAGQQVQRDWRPDLVLLDLALPSLDGLEVCRRLGAGTRAPILIVTARDAITDRVRGLDAGAEATLGRPGADHQRAGALGRRGAVGARSAAWKWPARAGERAGTARRSGSDASMRPRSAHTGAPRGRRRG
jgi:CheY-like chemotaxis protein